MSDNALTKPAEQAKPHKKLAPATNTDPIFSTAEEWLSLSMDVDESEVVFGSPSNCIVRPATKNLIEAPEKAFKTTFLLRLMLALSRGKTVFPQLPVLRPRNVLYIHGELAPREIQERTLSAAQDLSHPLTTFRQGRDLRIHLISAQGQALLKKIVAKYKPDDLVLDPWQAFIPGFDENEFKDVSHATHFMDMLIEEYKVTIYLATHTGKDPARGTRGHSSLAGWRDTLFRLRPSRGKELVEVTVEPRWAAPVKPFSLKFENGTLWSTDATGFTPQIAKIRELVEKQGGSATRDALALAMNLTGDALRKAIDRAAKARAVIVNGDEVRLPETDESQSESVEALLTGE